MRLLVINPNTTASMTEKIAQAARAAAAPGTEIVATNPREGPASIEGYYDEALCVPGVLEIVRKAQGVDGVVIACFDDTGLDAVRCLTAAPVIGIGEAGFHFAAMLSNKFSVVTTLARRCRLSSTTSSATASRLAAPGCGLRTYRFSISRRAIRRRGIG